VDDNFLRFLLLLLDFLPEAVLKKSASASA
jgi:hypothetical protein